MTPIDLLREPRSVWLSTARAIAAQCWGEPDTEKIEMDPRLAEAFAQKLVGWIDTAALFCGNAHDYRGLLDECAKHLGKAVYMADDGFMTTEPLRAKIPELVGKLKDDLKTMSAFRDIELKERNLERYLNSRLSATIDRLSATIDRLVGRTPIGNSGEDIAASAKDLPAQAFEKREA